VAYRFDGGVARKSSRVDVDQLRNWKLVEAFRSRVLPLLAGARRHPSEEDRRRTLHAVDYLSAFLLAVFNPAVSSLRALAALSQAKRMRQITRAPFTASSFSAGQHLFDASVLNRLVRQLAAELHAKNLGQEEHGGDSRVRQALASLTAVDGTIFRAVDRMVWARASGHGKAARLHVQFHIFEQTPERWTITPGVGNEAAVFGEQLRSGAFYVGDRLYGRHEVLEQLLEAGADFVIRLNNNSILTPVQERRPLRAEDRKAGVVWDQTMRLGAHGQGPVLRVVRVEAGGHLLHFATSRCDLDAELIGLIYRQRWQIELFFKWIKTMLNGRHWFAESPSGAQMQLYSVLVCALLLMLWTGRRPNRRAIEALRFYQMGWADEQDLAVLLRRAYPQKN